MSKFFDIVEPDPARDASKADADNAFTKGNGWRIEKRDTAYLLEYISGEISGREKSRMISAEDAAAMKSGELNLDGVLIKYGAS